MSPRINIGSGDGNSSRGVLVFLVISVAIAGYGGYDYLQQSEAVRNAVEVDATVVETGVDTESGRRGRVDYRPTATFEYSHDGETYTGNSVFPGSVTPTYDTESAARDVVADYEPGDTVTAYVDPASPGSAFLKNQQTDTPVKLAAIGLVGVLLTAIKYVRS
ncbi:DUF3592 domain-containing protein [Halobacterium jilantaiense]|uniref:DUF3592 domain-containing protein n=1 Tax=Halobacterium jilantaiense TaxID=355548 RepID=A0A1I0NF36_9EURY|nr:DUF3592 domain-containing protein [Halobacterium jilantaiense]SEV99369.1 Protein of unknown function [Halobacterium jilantaiense]